MPVVRVPLVGNKTQRASAYEGKDFEMLNMIAERVDNPVIENALVYAIKRPGMYQANLTTPVFPDGSADKYARGVFHWATYNILIAGWAQVAYVWDLNDLTKPPVTVGLQSNDSRILLGFTEYEGADKFLFMCDGIYSWKIDKDRNVTHITAAPSPHITCPTYLDGYIFLMTPEGKIFNSKLDDMLTWPADNYISAEMYPDKAVWLERQLNQLVAFGTKSVEYFYDAANATGSPLRKTEHVVMQTGTQWPHSVSQSNGVLGFVGVGTAGGNIVGLIEGFKLTQISIPSIERELDKENIVDVNGFFMHAAGHFLYVLVVETSDPTQDHMLVYDITEKMWYYWDSAKNIKDYGTYGDNTMFQINGTTKIFIMDTDSYTDAGDAITCIVRTSNWDGGNINRKFPNRLHVVGDTFPGIGLDTVRVRWSDDDYRTWSKYHPLNMNGRPVTHRGGNFRRRAWEVSFVADAPFRAESLEMSYEEGMM